jgi:hypothetical protein
MTGKLVGSDGRKPDPEERQKERARLIMPHWKNIKFDSLGNDRL